MAGGGNKTAATTAADAAKEAVTEAESKADESMEAEAETEAETAAAPANMLPGVLADFTAEATKPIQDEYNPDGKFDYEYAYCFYDWNGDGTDEVFYLTAQSASDGVTILDGTITAFVGSSNDPVSTNGRTSREYIEDIAEIELVGWIDIDPDDSNQELIVSAKKNDGTEQTIFFNSNYSGVGPDLYYVYDGAFKSWENGILTIGDVEYGLPEGRKVFMPVEELEG